MSDYIQDNACDVHCHTLARIDVLGPCRAADIPDPSVERPNEQQVTIKLIMTAELLAQLSYMAAGADQNTVSPALLALETERAN